MTAAELALRDASDDYAELEDTAVEAFREAVSWRALCLMALAYAQNEKARADLLEKRIRQMNGIESWHTAAEMEV